MKIVPQDLINVEDECRELDHGPRKNFIITRRSKFKKLIPAWVMDEHSFQLTLHVQPGSPVVGFASGRIKPFAPLDCVAIVEVIGIAGAYRGQGLAVKMHEFILKSTDMPIVAAHIQTPDGRDLWLRMLKHMKRVVFWVISNKEITRIASEVDIPQSMYDGDDATFVVEKLDLDRGPRNENTELNRIRKRAAKALVDSARR